MPMFRRIRISVRGLLILVLVLGGAMGWIVTHVNRARHLTPVDAIQQAGGFVYYDFDEDEAWFSWPQWLLDRTGPEYLANVIEVNGDSDEPANGVGDEMLRAVAKLSRLERLSLNNHKAVTNAGLVHLQDLKNLRSLELSDTGVAGSGLSHLRGLSRLESLTLDRLPVSDRELGPLSELVNLKTLQLRGVAITDAGLFHLARLKNLERLDLDGVPITDAGLVHLAPLNRLNSVSLDDTQITGAGLSSLREMTQLSALHAVGAPIDTLEPIRHLTKVRTLILAGTKIDDAGLAPVAGFYELYYLALQYTSVGDAGLAHIARLSNMKILHLHGTRISDDGLIHLAGLSRLESLSLSETAITDRGLKHLMGLTSLKSIAIDSQAGVTTAGITSLQQALPAVRIILRGPRGSKRVRRVLPVMEQEESEPPPCVPAK